MLPQMSKHCFVCQKEIKPASEGGHPSDPCAVTVTTNADGEEQEQNTQVLFCHFECFQQMSGGALWL